MALLSTSLLAVLLTLGLLLLQFATLRLISLSPHRRAPPTPRKRGTKTHLLIVLGSGGHTAEMISMLQKSISANQMQWKDYTHRTWVVSSGDGFSAAFADEFEKEIGGKGAYRVVQVRRARKVHQGLLTTPWSCALCFGACLRLLRPSSAQGKEEGYGYPDLILTNGPATATILVFASVFLRFLGLQGRDGRGEMRTVYVESWARVRKLSLSGRLLCWVVDRVLVQWEQLQGAGMGGRAEYRGVLVG